MRIGFLNNQIDNRGTGNALFDYAHYNEEILGNKSAILTLNNAPADELMAEKIFARFKSLRWGGDPNQLLDLDAIYHIKYGTDDGFRPPVNIPYLVHAVFDASQPHGDAYAAISNWLRSPNLDIPFVPHIIERPKNWDDLREELSIPKDAIVFGRHGGYDSFDVPFVWEAIQYALWERSDIYFVFMNTEIPEKFPSPNLGGKYRDRIISLPATSDFARKEAFINTCDAMLHARQRGETFGIAVGEFHVRGKPIITYGASPEGNHYMSIPQTYRYFGAYGLADMLTEFENLTKYRRIWNTRGTYFDYTPESVMYQFEKVFLDASTWSRNRAT